MEQETIQKKKVVDFFLKKNILLSSDILGSLEEKDLETQYTLITQKIKLENFLFFNKDLREAIQKSPPIDINWFDLEKSRALLEKGTDNKIYSQFLRFILAQKTKAKEKKVNIIFSYEEDSKKRGIQDFVQYFNARYQSIEKILRTRPELQNITTINRVLNKRDRETLSLIGIVADKQKTKNGNLMLRIEDQTGTINVLVNKNKPEIFEEAKSIVLDEIIGINGVNGENIIFANKIIWPEISFKELKKSQD